jgi:hypothetical protein
MLAIIPGLTGLTEPYWNAARQGRLVLQECRGCGKRQHPPLPACPDCHGTVFGWHECAGTGTVYTATVVRHPTHAAFADQVPYVIALIELAEGPRIVSTVTGRAPEDVTAGLPVRVWFRTVNDTVTLPYFEPDNSY